MTDALIVFAKPPEPGAVKTRLTTLLSDEEAAALYAAFLEDALRQYAALAADVRLYLTDASAALPVPDRVGVHEQSGAGLGARMHTAFQETFAAGYARAVIIGTDHPTLPSARIRRAFDALRPAPAVALGPSADGGFYLLGLTAPQPALFAGMTYSHDEVFAETRRRAEGLDARLTVLPEWYDVDTPAALQRMLQDLEGAPHAVRTRATVRRLNLRERLRAASR
ncbi:TIGR04282 family arsenosugar biosynthesis glycosyltransferase [Salisaeta longa]|uniref:TIGR04282 family arsenosugar biosynthesis glycosyltransferase n=1 Tax=Salisaeta longa TaxID=503170 RepID=UPI0003B3E986|nr:TIGR04282 family arsenosugar biosynthesis glycosyltransferase [Salisaeta longa]